MAQLLDGSISLDDRSSNISYTGNWTQGYNTDLFNGTDSYSAEQGDTAALSFYGTGVEYWGNEYNTHGPCQLTLDGADAGNITSYADNRSTPMQLWSRNNLTLGDHTLVITVILPDTELNKCEIDRFIVHGNTPTTSSTTSSPTLNASTGSVTSSKSSTPVAAIIGCVLGALALVTLIAFLWWWYTRTKRTTPISPPALDQEPQPEKQPPASSPIPYKARYMHQPSSTSAGESSSRGAYTSSEVPTSDSSAVPFQVPLQPPIHHAPPAYDEL